MIKSGQRWTQTIDTTPLTINWDMLSADYVPPSENSEYNDEEDNTPQTDVLDYSYLME